MKSNLTKATLALTSALALTMCSQGTRAVEPKPEQLVESATPIPEVSTNPVAQQETTPEVVTVVEVTTVTKPIAAAEVSPAPEPSPQVEATPTPIPDPEPEPIAFIEAPPEPVETAEAPPTSIPEPVESAETAPEPEPAIERSWVDHYDALLKKYVTASGIKYKAWHQSPSDRKALSGVISAIANEKLTGKSRDEKLAFYLNAYNAYILDRILKDYPTKGPGGGGLFGRNRFFKKKDLQVAGKTTSFTLLENETIRPTFQEPRIHFALNCASASCPPLNLKAFRSATLNDDLDRLTRAFVNQNPSGVKPINRKKIAVSKIFDWYADDFNAEGGVLAYINKYRHSKFASNTRVSYQSYSWTLNESR